MSYESNGAFVDSQSVVRLCNLYIDKYKAQVEQRRERLIADKMQDTVFLGIVFKKGLTREKAIAKLQKVDNSWTSPWDRAERPGAHWADELTQLRDLAENSETVFVTPRTWTVMISASDVKR